VGDQAAELGGGKVRALEMGRRDEHEEKGGLLSVLTVGGGEGKAIDEAEAAVTRACCRAIPTRHTQQNKTDKQTRQRTIIQGSCLL
jgi:hypothetical protein